MIHFNRNFICYFFNVIFLPVILYIISELCYYMFVINFTIVAKRFNNFIYWQELWRAVLSFLH